MIFLCTFVEKISFDMYYVYQTLNAGRYILIDKFGLLVRRVVLRLVYFEVKISINRTIRCSFIIYRISCQHGCSLHANFSRWYTESILFNLLKMSSKEIVAVFTVCNHHSTFCKKSFSFYDSISLQINGLWNIYLRN